MLGLQLFEESIRKGDVFQDATGFVVEVQGVDPRGFVSWTMMGEIMGAPAANLPSCGKMPVLAFHHRFIKLGHKALSSRRSDA
jgi:hypothetical protein